MTITIQQPCDTCTLVLVVDHDPAGRTTIRHEHQPACSTTSLVARIDRDNA